MQRNIKFLSALALASALAWSGPQPAFALAETDMGSVACGAANLVAVECVRGIPGTCDTFEEMPLDPCETSKPVAADPPELTCDELRAVLAVNCVYGNHLDCMVWEHPEEYEACR